MILSHPEGELLLASCAQDTLIRVWKLCVKSGSDAQDDPTIIKMKEDVFTVTRRGEEGFLELGGSKKK